MEVIKTVIEQEDLGGTAFLLTCLEVCLWYKT